ncbi:hypothetical protein SADUNF_Sadunf09G0017600 [Salix dunnii]|uniref:Fe2OG dioxygenase domain-containing protein n=1 Tax=Salix dunnii TaxID=1413687 RepID=A0A835JWA5_9ROSI|nr:hypothetical protein SADUNF_Sadunf09G0017600 [Salix dunnii]
MAGFFDLNIPQDITKTTRIKLAVKAMELGYSGIAYNRSIKGIMSDHDRCSIPLLSLSTLLDVAPSLAFSVNFHRDLLGIPRSSPFRQYTRLTVSADTPSQAQVLNSGNPVLKTYDFVAVKPLSQTAFDHACLKAEVDIIAIDFSEKLPFRLKLPMVKAAIERGVYFEITYSDLIADIQVRRQMIPSAKLLVDWTRGKNIILTSAACSVNDFRGPYDVANLSSLVGLSMERAKTAISKNCRNLIGNALRKKHFYKEAIRIEPISSDEISDTKELISVNWLKWDPISSGGDLQLVDIEKCFSATARVSTTAKAIDFSEVLNGMASNGASFLTAIQAIETPIAISGVSEKPGGFDFPLETDQASSDNASVKNQTSSNENSQEMNLQSDDTSAFTKSEGSRSHVSTIKEESKNPNISDVILPSIVDERHDMQSQKCIPSCEINAVLSNVSVMNQTSSMDINNTRVANAKIDASCENANFLAPPTENPSSSKGSFVVLCPQDVSLNEDLMEMDVKNQEDIQLTETVSSSELLGESQSDLTTIVDCIPLLATDDTKVENISLVANKLEVRMDEDDIYVTNDAMGREHLDESRDETVAPVDHIPLSVTFDGIVKDVLSVASSENQEKLAVEEQEHGDADSRRVLVVDDDLKAKDNSSVETCMSLEEEGMTKQIHEEASVESKHTASVTFLSGKLRAKRRTSHKPPSFPLKRLLNPMAFKKRSKKFKLKVSKSLYDHLVLTMESSLEAVSFGKSMIIPSVQEMAKESMTKIPPRYERPDQDPSINATEASPLLSPIPVIDLERLTIEDSMDSELDSLHSACREVSSALLEEFKKQVENFFKLSYEDKKKLWQKPNNHEGFGQLFVVSEEQKLDWSDMFYVTTLPIYLRMNDLFDKLIPNLRETLETYSTEVKKLAREILGHMAKGLKMAAEEMKELFSDGVQSIRMNYYPPCPEPEKTIGFSPHSDADALTILFQLSDTEGLEIRKEGRWIPVKPLPNAFVVNVGDITEIISNGVYRSVEHRAKVNSAKERLSVATFYSSNLDSVLGPAPSLLGKHNPAIFRSVPTEKYFKEFFSRKLDGKSYLECLRIADGEDNTAVHL